MANRQGLFRAFLNNIRQTLAVKNSKEFLIGTDHEGNRYFERPADPSKGVKRQRRVEPVSEDQFTVPKVPVEWMTWLQARREHPPSDNEMEHNYVTMMKTLRRADELDKQHEAVREKEPIDKTIAPSTAKKDFPVYKDYETYPEQFAEKYQPPKDDRR